MLFLPHTHSWLSRPSPTAGTALEDSNESSWWAGLAASPTLCHCSAWQVFMHNSSGYSDGCLLWVRGNLTSCSCTGNYIFNDMEERDGRSIIFFLYFRTSSVKVTVTTTGASWGPLIFFFCIYFSCKYWKYCNVICLIFGGRHWCLVIDGKAYNRKFVSVGTSNMSKF